MKSKKKLLENSNVLIHVLIIRNIRKNNFRVTRGGRTATPKNINCFVVDGIKLVTEKFKELFLSITLKAKWLVPIAALMIFVPCL